MSQEVTASNKLPDQNTKPNKNTNAKQKINQPKAVLIITNVKGSGLHNSIC